MIRIGLVETCLRRLSHSERYCTNKAEGKFHVRLTEFGSKCALNNVNIMNRFDPEILSGRVRDVLIILKEKDLVDQVVKVKNFAKVCAQFGFSVETANLRIILRKGHYFFILDLERDSLSLTPPGKKAIKQLEEASFSIRSLNMVK